MRIILTSFMDSNNWKGIKCSIARWQPDWSSMSEFVVDVKPILYHYNRLIRTEILTEKMNPNIYRLKYEEILKRKHNELIDFFSKIESDEDLILCCWCTLDRQPQFKGKLFCHRILLGYWIEDNFKYFRVIYSDGAEKSIWRKNENK